MPSTAQNPSQLNHQSKSTKKQFALKIKQHFKGANNYYEALVFSLNTQKIHRSRVVFCPDHTKKRFQKESYWKITCKCPQHLSWAWRWYDHEDYDQSGEDAAACFAPALCERTSFLFLCSLFPSDNFNFGTAFCHHTRPRHGYFMRWKKFWSGGATKRRRLGYQHSSFFSRQISNEFLLQIKSL